MDINPYRFETSFTDYEFANRMLADDVRLVILSMAWLTYRSPDEIAADPGTPDMETVAYWRERFLPFIEASQKKDILVIFANRCGVEGNVARSLHVENGEIVEEGDRVCYAGSSCVMLFSQGAVRMFERKDGVAILGKGEEGALLVDTGVSARYSLQPGR
jgi:protein N-terminal amidase